MSYEDRSPVERVSGQSLVPVVEFDDGAVVIDSMQIVKVLEERFPAAPLYPADFAGRARAMRFIDWFNGVWKVAPNAIAAEIASPQPDVQRIDALAEAMAGALVVFERMLDGRAYLLGDEFSAADCAAYPFLRYAAWRDPADDELFHRVLDSYQQLGDDHPRLKGWIERIDERPRV
ncbi:MAG TPA: glutathione S-transferase family protein [Solirubrobacteraceae bacterium]|nr:glutathione S-transferase family protein [Solirubrobacteraceae bacterium]